MGTETEKKDIDEKHQYSSRNNKKRITAHYEPSENLFLFFRKNKMNEIRIFKFENQYHIGRMSNKRGRQPSDAISSLTTSQQTKLTSWTTIVKTAKEFTSSDAIIKSKTKKEIGTFDVDAEEILDAVKNYVSTISEEIKSKSDEIELLQQDLTDRQNEYLSSLRKLTKEELEKELLFSTALTKSVSLCSTILDTKPNADNLAIVQDTLVEMEKEKHRGVINTRVLRTQFEPATQETDITEGV